MSWRSNPKQPPTFTAKCVWCLHSVVDTLRPEYSEILRAVDLGEQRVQDFAQQHNLSASNAGVRAHRARAALRKQLMGNVLELCRARMFELYLQADPPRHYLIDGSQD